MTIDRQDRAILTRLQGDARAPHAEIGEQIGMSTSSVHRRVKALEAAGIIEGYSARLNEKALGRGASVFVRVSLKNQRVDDLRAFEDAVTDCPDVLECYLMTGEADYLVRVAVRDAADYERVHTQVLTRLPGVERLVSQFTIRSVFRRAAV
ncbi:Lrp/AsnC family transcriptional regulator [Henriciella litoralis]|uniref:Lrp/AsnC family transcriptional regulator n=1 Tax=Henriciella litoralis TaxID=568102 RepID=UPI000A019026|nr:Lrp/AsnC family transcriptional regulator [Henriciella litoralis]